MTLIEFPIEDGGIVHVEVPTEAYDDGGLARVGAGDRLVQAATQSWSRALDGMRLAAEGALGQMRGIEPAPDEVEVTFGVAMDGKIGATIVSGGSAAHLNVKVTWKNPATGETRPD